MSKHIRAAFSVSLCFSAALACDNAGGSRHGDSSRLAEFGTGAARQEDVKSRIDSATGKVTFYYLHDGVELDYQPMHEGDVFAKKKAEGRWSLEFGGVQIGEKQGDLLKICDKYDIDGQSVVFPCNAIFYHQEKHPAKDQNGQYSEHFMMDISLGDLPREGLNLAQTERVDLSNYAQNQINQYDTGTCYYNSMTGLLEIFYSMKTGQAIDLSEPDLLTRFEPRTDEENNYLGIVSASRLSLLKNSDLPVTKYYRPGVDFYSAYGAAENGGAEVRQQGTRPVSLGMRIDATKLFWYGRWKKGYTTETDFKKTANWLMEKRQPVHLQHVVNGIWHAVIMMGYDPATEQVLIKDSLGNSNLKGTWKTKKWFMEYTYGAVGTESPDVVNNTSSSDTSNTQEPSSITALIGKQVNDSSLGSNEAYVMWLAAPKTTNRLVFCEPNGATTCAPDSSSYTTTALRKELGDKALFEANRALVLQPNLQILVLALDANGQVLTSRKLRFERN